MKRENEWRKRLQDLIMATWPQSKIIKMHVGVMDSAGMPDIHVQSRGLGGVWLELKYVRGDQAFDWSEQPTLLQKEQLRGLYYAGAKVGVIVFFDEWWCSVHGHALIHDAFAFDVKPNCLWDSTDKKWQTQLEYSDTTVAEFTKLVWGSGS